MMRQLKRIAHALACLRGCGEVRFNMLAAILWLALGAVLTLLLVAIEVPWEAAQRWQTTITGAVGFCGVILTLVMNAWNSRALEQRKIKNERRGLAGALIGEISEIRGLYQAAADSGWKAPGNPVYRHTPTSKVVDAAAGKLGLMTSETARCVARFAIVLAEREAYLLRYCIPHESVGAGGMIVPSQDAFDGMMHHCNRLIETADDAIVALQGELRRTD